jgi:hypothetical protein
VDVVGVAAAVVVLAVDAGSSAESDALELHDVAMHTATKAPNNTASRCLTSLL